MVDPVSKTFCLRLSNVFYMLVIILLESQTSTLAAVHEEESHQAWSLCQDEPAKFLPPPYHTRTGFTCAPIWHSYVLSFSQDKDNVSTLVLLGNYTAQWLGIGLSEDGKMRGSSAMVGWVAEDGKSSVKQYYLEGKTPSQVIPGKGDLKLTNVAPVVARQDNIFYMAFQIKFETKRGDQKIVLALGNGIPRGNTLTYHVDRTSTTVDLTAGTPASALENPESSKTTHAVLAIVGWGALIPLGSVVPRNFRHGDPFSFYCHSTINFVGFSIGLVSVSNGGAIRQKVKDPQTKKWAQVHKGVGIALVVFSTLQILTFIVKSEKEPESRSYRFWFQYHRWVGVLIILAGYLNIVVGIQIGKANTFVRATFAASLAISVVTFIVLEVKSFFRGPRQIHDEPPPVFKPDPNPAVFKADAPPPAPFKAVNNNKKATVTFLA